MRQLHLYKRVYPSVGPLVGPLIGPLVCRFVRWSVGPLVTLLSGGRDEPANDLFRVYKLVFHPVYHFFYSFLSLYFFLTFSGRVVCPFWGLMGTPGVMAEGL